MSRMAQQRPSCLLILALVLLVSVGLGALIVYVLAPAARGERPADLTPTVAVLDPTPRVGVSPTAPTTPTPAPTENILRPTSTPRPTEVPTATPVPPTPVLAPSPEVMPKPMVQKG